MSAGPSHLCARAQPGAGFSRRSLLRQIAVGGAASFALPVLESHLNAHGTAFADGTPLPKVFGYIHWGNGAPPETFTPAQAGTGAAWTLSPILTPLAALKPYLTVVSGTQIELTDYQHPQGASNILTGTNYTPPVDYENSSPAGPSLDQLIANGLAAQTPFRSLEVAVYRSIEKAEGLQTQYISHGGVNSPNPPTFSPRALFDRLFAGAAMPGAPGEPPDPRQKYRKSVLDLVREDIKRLASSVSAADKTRLERHTDGIRALEMQLGAGLPSGGGAGAPAGSCGQPTRPGDEPSRPSHADFETISRQMGALLGLALSCGLTRVFSLQITGSRDFTSYDNVGVGGNYHSITHDGEVEPLTKVVTYVQKHLALAVQALADTPYGAGNVLDQACILASSEVATGHDHKGWNWPVLVLGKAGGDLRGDQHIVAKGKHTLSVHLALMKIMGLSVSSFGLEEHLKVTSPLGGLS